MLGKIITDYLQADNARREWGFDKMDLIVMLEMHKSGNPIMREMVEYQLTDCNYHTFCGLLEEGKYQEAEKWIADNM